MATAKAKAQKAGPTVEPEAELPSQIADVFSRVDHAGRPTEKLVVKYLNALREASYIELDSLSLIQQDYAELARLALLAKLYQYRSRKGLRDLADVLMRAAIKPIYVADKDGFHALELDGGRFEFLVWNGSIRPMGRVVPILVVAQCDRISMPVASGTIEEWHQHIGCHLTDNPALLLIVCVALSALLCRPFRIPRLTIMIVGGSSLGKGTALQIALSLVEYAGTVKSLSGTAKGIRNDLSTNRDRPAPRDEPRQAEDRGSLISLIFDIANGAQRLVATADQGVHASESMSCLLMLANESTLDEMLGPSRVLVNEGVGARYFEYHVNPDTGVFLKPPNGLNPKQFAEKLQDDCGQYYGAVWERWVEVVAKNAEEIKHLIETKMPELEASLSAGLDIDDAVTRRLVRGLAGWAFAGCIAAKYGVLQVKNKIVIQAVRCALTEHIARRKQAATPFGEKVVSAVRDIIDRNSGRFAAFGDVCGTDQANIYGYRKTTNSGTLFLFLPTVFEQLVGERFGTAAALRQLRAAGHLSADKNGDQRQFRVPGSEGGDERRKRFYAIKETIRFEK